MSDEQIAKNWDEIKDQRGRWEYRFDIHRPVNRDVVVLSLRRYWRTDSWNAEVTVMQVLTLNGWHTYQPHEMIPEGELPTIDGLNLTRWQNTLKVLDDFEQHIREVIRNERTI